MFPKIPSNKDETNKPGGNKARRRRGTIVDGNFPYNKTPDLNSVAKILRRANYSSDSLNSGYTTQESNSSREVSPVTLPPIAPVVVEDMGSLADSLHRREIDLDEFLKTILKNERESDQDVTIKVRSFKEAYDGFIKYDPEVLKGVIEKAGLSKNEFVTFSIYLLYSVLDDCAYGLRDFNNLFLRLDQSSLKKYEAFQGGLVNKGYGSNFLAGGFGSELS